MKKLIIFDMDGLMFDSEKLAGECLIQAANHYGYAIPYTIRLELLGKNRDTNANFLLKTFGKDFPIDDIFTLSNELKNKAIEQNGLEMKPGLIELLDYIKQQKILIAVASSSNKETIKKYLHLHNLEDYFNCIVSGDMVNRCKPDPEIFITACQYFGIKPQDALVLEDSLSGIQAAFHGDIDSICIPDIVVPEEKYLSITLGCFKDLFEAKDFMIEKGLI